MMPEKMDRERLCRMPANNTPHPAPQRLFRVIAAAAAAAQAGPNGFSPEAVEKAVKNGLEYLKKSQDADGAWPAHGDYTVAPTAIATYAMLESDMIKVTDPRMEKALDWLGKRQIPANSLLRRVRSGATTIPSSDNTYCHNTYELGLRANAFLAASYRSGMQNSPYRPFLRTDVLMLMLSTADGSYGDDSLGDGKGSGDNHNSLYGLFGVWAAVQADMEVPRDYWRRVLKHWQDCQNPDGGWALAAGKPSSATATAGGLVALTVSSEELLADRFLDCNAPAEIIKPINNAIEWTGTSRSPWPLPIACFGVRLTCTHSSTPSDWQARPPGESTSAARTGASSARRNCCDVSGPTARGTARPAPFATPHSRCSS